MTDTRYVYVVMGEESDYDGNTWIDSVWTSKRKADARAETKNKRHRQSFYEVEKVALNIPDGRDVT